MKKKTSLYLVAFSGRELFLALLHAVWPSIESGTVATLLWIAVMLFLGRGKGSDARRKKKGGKSKRR